MIYLEDFKQEIIELNIYDVKVLQESLGFKLPSHFVEFTKIYGKLSHKKKMYSVNSYPFSSTVSVLDYIENLDYFKESVFAELEKEYVVFMFTYDPNRLILMGVNSVNENKIFEYNNVSDIAPILICHSYVELFQSHFVRSEVI